MNQISVIIPCYNVEKYISSCLNSVIAQTVPAFEILCIDDGSTDRTLEILRAYEKKFPAVVSVFSVPNNGAPKARNMGLKNAKGNIIQFLDADDLLVKTKFEKQLQGFDDSVDVVISDRIYKNEDLTQTIANFNFRDIEINPLETAVTRIIITGNPLYKKKMVEELNGYNENLKSAQDWEFHLRIVLNGYKLKYVPGEYFIGRRVSGSVSSNWIKVGEQAAIVVKQLKDELLKSSLINTAIRQYIAQTYMNTAVFSKNENTVQFATMEMEFWAQHDYRFIQSRFKKLLINVFGVRAVIKLLRIKNRY